MKALALFGLLLFATLSSTLSYANEVSDVLSQYENADINGNCTVDYDGRVVRIDGSVTRQDFSAPVEYFFFKEEILLATYRNYDGQAEVYFIPREYSLLVVGLWEDFENGDDVSSFCELPLLDVEFSSAE